ncbi:MAG: hypothetical protein MJE77_45945 [Proteobacteria bacterium]|nr:hypothetical protein [Pseudomonadota bacterium]
MNPWKPWLTYNVKQQLEQERESRDAIASESVKKAVKGDILALGTVRGKVFEVIYGMRNLPQSPLKQNPADYFSAVAVATIERLEANNYRALRKYLASVDKGRVHFSAYVANTARWVAIDLTRKEYNRIKCLKNAQTEPVVQDDSTVCTTWDDKLDVVKAMRVLREMKPQVYEALSLRAQGYSWEEIVALTGARSRKSIEGQTHRAIANLHRLLKKEQEKKAGRSSVCISRSAKS